MSSPDIQRAETTSGFEAHDPAHDEAILQSLGRSGLSTVRPDVRDQVNTIDYEAAPPLRRAPGTSGEITDYMITGEDIEWHAAYLGMSRPVPARLHHVLLRSIAMERDESGERYVSYNKSVLHRDVVAAIPNVGEIQMDLFSAIMDTKRNQIEATEETNG